MEPTTTQKRTDRLQPGDRFVCRDGQTCRVVGVQRRFVRTNRHDHQRTDRLVTLVTDEEPTWTPRKR